MTAAHEPAAIAPVAHDQFGAPDVSPELMQRALLTHAVNQSQGTAATKSRGEVTASTAKLYRQKGTGRARAGSSSSPVRRGGGVAFGPTPGRRRASMNKKERRQAVRGLLAAMAAEQRLSIADDWGDSPKTRDRAAWLQRTGLHGRVLLVDVDPPDDLRRSSRNIPNLSVARADSLGFYDIAAADHVVTSPPALDALRARVGA